MWFEHNWQPWLFQQKGAEYECNGRLDNFRLEFANYSARWQGALATLVESPGKEVWGCVWKMPNEYSDSLDEQEKGYHRLMGESVVFIGIFKSSWRRCFSSCEHPARRYHLPDVPVFGSWSRPNGSFPSLQARHCWRLVTQSLIRLTHHSLRRQGAQTASRLHQEARKHPGQRLQWLRRRRHSTSSQVEQQQARPVITNF